MPQEGWSYKESLLFFDLLFTIKKLSTHSQTLHTSLEIPARVWCRARPLASCTETLSPTTKTALSPSEQFNTCLFLQFITFFYSKLLPKIFIQCYTLIYSTKINPQISHISPHYWQSIVLLTAYRTNMEIRHAGISRKTENFYLIAYKQRSPVPNLKS